MDSDSITITRKSGKTQTFIPAPLVPPVPTNRQYYFVKQDDQMPWYTGRPIKNRPMIFRLYNYNTIPFNKDMQLYHFSLNRSDDEARDKRAWSDENDTWSTNARKVREHADYVNQVRLEKPDPSWASLVMGRNVVCGEEVLSDGTYGIPFGRLCLKLETMDINHLIEGATYETHPHLIHHCTNITSAKYDGLFKVNPFPQMGGRVYPPFRPTFYPLMWNKPLYIEMKYLSKLPLGRAIPNPYNPRWDW